MLTKVSESNTLRIQATVEIAVDRASLDALVDLVQTAIEKRGLSKQVPHGQLPKEATGIWQRRARSAATRHTAPDQSPSVPEPPKELLLDTQTVAKLLGVSDRTVWAYANSGQMMRPIRIGRAVRWPRNELFAWVNAGCPTHEQWQALRSQKGFG